MIPIPDSYRSTLLSLVSIRKQQIAPDANIARMVGSGVYPYAKKCLEEHKKLEKLEAIINQSQMGMEI